MNSMTPKDKPSEEPASSQSSGNNNPRQNGTAGPPTVDEDDFGTNLPTPGEISTLPPQALFQEELLPKGIPVKGGIVAQISAGLAAAAISTPSETMAFVPYGSGSDGDGEEGFEDQDQPEDNSILSYAESLEEGTIRHMQTSGFLAQLKGEIAKYMFDITKASLQSSIIPDRADKELLAQIYDYLVWVGMKGSAAVLLSESPMSLKGPEIIVEDGSKPTMEKDKEEGVEERNESREKEEESVPKLVTLFGLAKQMEVEAETKVKEEEEQEDKKVTQAEAPEVPETKHLTEDIQEDKAISKQVSKTPSKTEELVQNQLQESLDAPVAEDVSLTQKSESIPEMKEENKTTPATNVDLDKGKSATLVNKQLSKPHLTTNSGDLLTGSPLSSPSPASSLTKLPSTLEKPDSVPSTRESFDDLLMAYVGTEKGSSDKFQKSKSDLDSLPSPNLGTTPPPPESPPPVSPDDNLMAFTFTSTPIREPQVPKTPAETAPTDATYSIEKLQATERSFFSKPGQNLIEEEPTTSESSPSSSAVSDDKDIKEPQKFEIDTESPLGRVPSGKKSEPDNSTSDALSVSLEELENDNTLDISLPSDVNGTSGCDHVVRLKE